MTDDTWTPGEDDTDAEGEGVDDNDVDPGAVARRRGKTRIEATRSPNRSTRTSGRSFVVRKGSLESGEANDDE